MIFLVIAACFDEIQRDELNDMSKKAGRYAAAAKAARETIDKQLDHLPCLCASNNLLYCFLMEARRVKEKQATEYSNNNRNFQENFTANLKRAADSVKDQALRIYDGTTAQKVPYLGPMIAKMIREELWSLYPPEPPSEEELEERRRFEDREKEQTKRKRQAAKERERAAAVGADPSTSAMNGISPDIINTTNNNNNSPPSSLKPRKKRERKPTEYIPAFGSANYALMLTMYEAQAGPEKKEYLSKQDLLDRSEASGLSNFPLAGNNPALTAIQGDPRNFYNGWSGFNSQLVKHDLMRAWSNPKKIQLTRKGLDLAGRLYVDAIARGTLRPFPVLLDNNNNNNGGGNIAQQRQQQQSKKRQSKGKSTAMSEEQVRRDSLDVSLADRLRKREEDELALTIAASLGAVGDKEEKKKEKKTQGGKRRAVSLFNNDDDSNDDENNNHIDNAPKQIIRSRKTQIIVVEEEEEDVVDLLDDDDDDDADANKHIAAVQTLATTTTTTTTDASVLLELGYSKRRSLKVLCMTKDIDQAMEIIDALSSSSESEKDEGEEAGHVHAATLQPHQPQVTSDNDDDAEVEEEEEGRRPIRNKKPKRSVDFVRLFSPTLKEIEEEKEHDHPPVERRRRKKTEIDYDQHHHNNKPPSPIPPPPSQQQHQRGFMSPPSKQALSQQPLFAPSPSQTSSHLLNMGHIRGHQPMTQVAQQQYSQQRGFASNNNNNDRAIKLPPLLPGTCFKDVYDVVMLVDGREQYARTASITTNNNTASTSSATAAAGASRIAALQTHIQTMTNKGIDVEHRMLPIGDALWVARPKNNNNNNTVTGTGTSTSLTHHHHHQEWVLDYVLERKSLADLVGSITSGRYESQCYGLRRCGLDNRFYLIEGEVDRMAKPTDQKMIRTKCAEIDVEGDFKLLCSINHQDTFRLYDRLTTAIYGHYADKMVVGDDSNNADDIDVRLMTYSEWKDHVEIVTKGATTVHDLWGLMLMQVPGLGPETISTIIHHYPTPMSLYMAYREVKMRDGGGGGREWVSRGERMLVGLKPREGGGGGREVGPEKSKKVFNMLFRKGWE